MENMCNKATPLEDVVLRDTKTMPTKRREQEWVVLISTSTLWKRRGCRRHIALGDKQKYRTKKLLLLVFPFSFLHVLVLVLVLLSE